MYDKVVSGQTIYAYVNGNPLNGIDPSGLVKIHGNWCGPNWTGGQQGPYIDAPSGFYAPPVGIVDGACQKHDICYADCRKSSKCSKDARGKCMTQCDRELAGRVVFNSNSGTSLANSAAIYTWMNWNTFPDPGENDKSCDECSKD